MKKKILILAFILLLGGNIIMSAIQMYQRNGTNTAWDEKYPVTTAENVKVGSSNLTEVLDNIGDASPKGVYATLSALQTAFPTGTNGIYVVTADGKWYYWNGSAWTAGGQYQSTGIADKSITPEKTSFITIGKNLFDKSKAAVGYYVNELTGELSANSIYNTSDFIKVESGTQYSRTGNNRVAFYDTNKTFISGIVSGTVNTPANCVYMRCSFAETSIDAIQVEKGAILTAYEPYYQVLDSKYFNLPKNSIDITKTNFVTTGKNLFDKSKASMGYVVNETTGAIYVNATYAASDFIPVEPSNDYVSAFSRATAYYDVNKIYISGAQMTTAITTPSGCYFVRVSPYANAVESFQFEKGSLATAFEPYGYRFTKELPSKDIQSTEMVLPQKIYALVGQELNIYFDNIMNDKDAKYEFDVVCNIGGQYENYYRVTPESAGTYPITIKAYRDGIERAIVTSSIIVTASSVGSGINKKVLIIGDSTTANGICTQKLLDNFGASEVMDITLLGTKGASPNLNEGISGWTVNQYFTTSDDGAYGNVNAFWNTATSKFDFSYYMTQQGYSGVDYVIINLGINDTFSYTDDVSLQTKINTMLTQYQGIIDSIYLYNANVKVGLAITIPPAYDQNGFGKNYGCGQTRWRYKRNNFLWAKALINAFNGKESSNIYLVPINTNLDTRYNMGLETLPVNARNTEATETSIISNGNVHPAESGYWQIADVYWYWIKSFEN